jgi:hypothetical protein
MQPGPTCPSPDSLSDIVMADLPTPQGDNPEDQRWKHEHLCDGA